MLSGIYQQTSTFFRPSDNKLGYLHCSSQKQVRSANLRQMFEDMQMKQKHRKIDGVARSWIGMPERTLSKMFRWTLEPPLGRERNSFRWIDRFDTTCASGRMIIWVSYGFHADFCSYEKRMEIIWKFPLGSIWILYGLHAIKINDDSPYQSRINTIWGWFAGLHFN